MSDELVTYLLLGLVTLGGAVAVFVLLVGLLSGLRALGVPRRRGPEAP